jgi:excisionase family DNA binding protein
MNLLSPLARAQRLLEQRLVELEARLAAGEDLWTAYAEAATALAAIAPTLAPGQNGQLLTTAELAARLQISVRTLRRRAKSGQLEPVRLGQRGRAALRWPAEATR